MTKFAIGLIMIEPMDIGFSPKGGTFISSYSCGKERSTMKVIITKRDGGKFDVRVRRTRRSEGTSQSAKGLTLDGLREFTSAAVEAIAHPRFSRDVQVDPDA